MVHSMKLKEGPLRKIADGTKTIEMRLYDEKRKKLQVGDTVEFTNMTTGDKLQTQVLALHKCHSFEDLYNKFNKVSLGYAKQEVAVYTDMSKYYSNEDIEKYGVVGIEIKLI